MPRSWRESGGTDGGGVAETVREAGGDDPWVVASWYEGSLQNAGEAGRPFQSIRKEKRTL